MRLSRSRRGPPGVRVPRRRGPSARGHGFSLIEILVAVTVLALVLGVIYQVLGSGLQAADRSAGYGRAVVHANSVLAALGVESPPAEGVEEGEFEDGYRWRVEISPYVAPEDHPLGETEVRPVRVGITIAWDEGRHERSVGLETVRLLLQ